MFKSYHNVPCHDVSVVELLVSPVRNVTSSQFYELLHCSSCHYVKVSGQYFIKFVLIFTGHQSYKYIQKYFFNKVTILCPIKLYNICSYLSVFLYILTLLIKDHQQSLRYPWSILCLFINLFQIACYKLLVGSIWYFPPWILADWATN